MKLKTKTKKGSIDTIWLATTDGLQILQGDVWKCHEEKPFDIGSSTQIIYLFIKAYVKCP